MDELPRIEVRPHPGPQTEFLSTRADIAIYGGAAGSGKTYAEILDPLRYAHMRDYGAVIFRRTSEEVRMEGGLWDETRKLYPLLGAKGREHQLDWRFPSGASVTLDSVQFDQDLANFQGAQICGLYFDELTHFTQYQFFYLLSRNRSTCGIRPYVRATTNPDANSWVKQFLAPWVDREHPNPAKSGELRWFVRSGDEVIWVDEGTPDSKSVAFIRASIYDNPTLMAADPGYLANLKALPMVERRRLLDGDWDIVEGGNMFRSDWFRIIDSLPHLKRRVRFWDVAASEAKAGRDPDWTVGVLMGLTGDKEVVIEDVQRTRSTPLAVEELVSRTAEQDGKSVWIRMEQEPGSSGVTVIDHFRRNVLFGFSFDGVKSTGSKAERAKPYSAHAENGHVMLLRAPWNQTFINEHPPFPTDGVHDDQVDAASGAFGALADIREVCAPMWIPDATPAYVPLGFEGMEGRSWDLTGLFDVS